MPALQCAGALKRQNERDFVRGNGAADVSHGLADTEARALPLLLPEHVDLLKAAKLQMIRQVAHAGGIGAYGGDKDLETALAQLGEIIGIKHIGLAEGLVNGKFKHHMIVHVDPDRTAVECLRPVGQHLRPHLLKLHGRTSFVVFLSLV